CLPQIFNKSQMNLGFSDTGWHSGTGVTNSNRLQCRLRDFEVPMAGGFYLVQEAPDHQTYYKSGEEIETWSEPDELIDKLIFYSRNVRPAERIREAGQKRALTSHTWQHRFDHLIKKLDRSKSQNDPVAWDRSV
ncbi:MAG: glycosyltransferase, partial [Nitrospira sp.]|nr:glycosyltransferase [Nitrospira sp.]